MELDTTIHGLTPPYAKRRAVVTGAVAADVAHAQRAYGSRWSTHYAQPMCGNTRSATIYLGRGADGRDVYLAGDDDSGGY